VFWAYRNWLRWLIRNSGPIINSAIDVLRDRSTDSSGSEGLSNAQSAIMFSIAPLTSLSTMTPQLDPDPVASQSADRTRNR
jgi:hypothetical protein